MSTVPTPKARPAASVAAIVLGLVMIGVASVSLRDLAVARGWTSGQSWTGSVVSRLDGLTPGVAVVIAGALAVLVGLWVGRIATKPARATHERAAGESDVWISAGAVRTLAARAAEDTPGVAEASARTRRSRVVVTVQSDRADARAQVEANVRSALAGLTAKDICVKTEKVTYDS